MPRNARRDPARNQGRILNAAAAEFARHGLGGARLRHMTDLVLGCLGK